MIETPLRKRLDLSEGWAFVRGRVGRRWLSNRGHDGQIVDLPHCWNAHDTFQPGLRSFSGYGAYRTTFRLPTSDLSSGEGFWRLKSEGFYGVGDLWLDGTRLTRIDGQYLGFQHDLQPTLAAGEHVLSVRLDNRYHPNVLPGTRAPDFILHGGLAGRVFIERVPALNVETDSIEVVSGTAGGAGESLRLRCVLSNRSTETQQGEILWTITDAGGAHIASATDVPFEARPGTRSLPLEAVVRLPDCLTPNLQLCTSVTWSAGFSRRHRSRECRRD